jgi:uncharacterized protein YdaU (DUF1376 family)
MSHQCRHRRVPTFLRAGSDRVQFGSTRPPLRLHRSLSMPPNRLPWFPCYPSKFLGALSAMQPDEGYVYVIVCFRIYESGKPCPDTLEAIARRAGMNKRRASEALERLFRSGKLVREGDGIMNPYAAEILAEGIALRKRREEASQKANAAPREKNKENQSTPSPIRTPVGAAADPHLHLHKQEQDSLFPNGKSPSIPQTSDWPADYREQFWTMYPRRTEKKAAIAKLDALRKSGKVPWTVFLLGVTRHAAACAGTEERYIKHPTTWLNRGCWEDEQSQNGGGNGQARRNDSIAGAFDELRRDLSRAGNEEPRDPPMRDVTPAGARSR